MQAYDPEPQESGLRELPEQDKLLLPRDRMPVVLVPPSTWNCWYCEQAGGEGAHTTIVWLSGEHDGPDGRCTQCGQLYVLANASDRHVPTPDEQVRRHEALEAAQGGSPE